MALKKRRSDIQKLVTAAREIWRMSQVYQQVKKSAKVADKVGWWWACSSCKREAEAIKIDHIKAIGRQPDVMHNFGEWLEKLFCDESNLQALCQSCHALKTKEDKKALK